MFEYLILFFVGIIWLIIIGIQNILLIKGHRDLHLFIIAVIGSIVWAYLVRCIVIGFDFLSVMSYSLGSAVGLVLSRKIVRRFEENG